MAFAKDTIRVGAAQKIFTGCTIEPVEVGGKVAFYRITHGATVIEDVSITEACRQMWESISNKTESINNV